MEDQALDIYKALFEPYAQSFLGFIQRTEEEALHALAFEGLERASKKLTLELEKEVIKERRFYLELALACLEHFSGEASKLYRLYEELNEGVFEGYLASHYAQLAGFDFDRFSPEVWERREDRVRVDIHPFLKALNEVASYGVFHEYYRLFADMFEVEKFSKVYLYAKSWDDEDYLAELTGEDWELLEKGTSWTIHGWLMFQADIFGHLKKIREYRHYPEPILMYPFYEYAKVLIEKWPRALDVLRKYSRFLKEEDAFTNAYRIVLCKLEEKECPEPKSLTARRILEAEL